MRYDKMKPGKGRYPVEIYVYGTGCGAGDLIDRALPLDRVCAFVESSPKADSFMGRPVISPRELAERPYDLVIVTSRQAEAIAAECQAAGLESERILFLKNHQTLTDRNRCYAIAEKALGPSFVAELKTSARLIPQPPGGESLDAQMYANDYVRIKTLELLCARLEKVNGAVAELGVFKGAFARALNALMPQRELHLFDSFTGFAEGEMAELGDGMVAAHRSTAAECVRAVLPYPEKAFFHPGLFPASADGVEARFALVSLDVDVEESTLAGLRWFVPRMEKGGFLLLHDWGNPALPGVRRAVERYEQEHKVTLPAVPLCDSKGTLVIAF